MFFALFIFNFVQAHGKKILANLINRNGLNFSMVKIVILYHFDIAMNNPLIIKDSISLGATTPIIMTLSVTTLVPAKQTLRQYQLNT